MVGLVGLFYSFRAGDKGDLTKKFDQVRVWYRWKGYLSGSMENGCWGVTSGGIGHQRSFKVNTHGHLKKKCDLTKNFDKLCVSYYWKSYLAETVENWCWGVGRGGIGHQRSHKVINQGHVTKKSDLTKHFHLVCVWDDWIGYIPSSMDNGCWRVGSGEIGHQRSFKVTTYGHLR